MKNSEILLTLKEAKNKYINIGPPYFDIGMCFCLIAVMMEKFKISTNCSDLRVIIPKFNSKFLKGDKEDGFWWDLDDSQSRVTAFNVLIGIYEDKVKYDESPWFIKILKFWKLF